MAFRFDDRVAAVSASIGVGDFALGAAAAGARDFTLLAVGDQFGYTIENQDVSAWETGIGTYSAANTLTRTRVLASSNAGAKVNFAAGDKTVRLTLTSEQLGTVTKPLTFPVVTYSTMVPISRVGWVLSASSSGGGALGNAVDSNTGTRWATGSTIVPNTSFFQIDTGAIQPLGGVRVDHSGVTGDVPLTGKVQGSNDGVAWTDLATWTTGANFVNPFLTVSWVPANWRYLKLIATGLANGASSNWWSISEINLSATIPPPPSGLVEVVAAETIVGRAGWALRVRGNFRKGSTTDDIEFKVGLDANNWYGFRFQGGNIKISKSVAGAVSDLGNTLFANDTAPHIIEFVIHIADATIDQQNWLAVQVTQAAAGINTLGVFDNGLDFRAGVKQFRLKIIDTSEVRGLAYKYGPTDL